GYVTTGVAGPEAEVVLVDRSGSTDEPGQRGTKMDDIKVALRGHGLQKMHIDRQDQMALVSFASDARVDCAWTRLQDPSPLLTAISALYSGGGTCFRSGLELAEGLFASLPGVSGVQVLQKVIFFTDGHNNEGDPVPVADRLRNAGVIIRAVGFGRREKDVDVATLRSIVSVINGQEQYWFCSSARELTRTFKALSRKTRIFRT
ncbi:MAG: VWA domain-containing protein, partial [Planctomycetes bacterium]|nr:VWA domain-containing protein [Planctomycetota bacterium]